jgi:hypothetical protein
MNQVFTNLLFVVASVTNIQVISNYIDKPHRSGGPEAYQVGYVYESAYVAAQSGTNRAMVMVSGPDLVGFVRITNNASGPIVYENPSNPRESAYRSALKFWTGDTK